MSFEDPNYKDENGHIVHETWADGKLVSKEVSEFGDLDNRGYHEVIQFDDDGKKKNRTLYEHTPHGIHKLEERYNRGFLSLQKEETSGTHIILAIRTFYPQVTPDGTRLDKEILQRETIINQTTGKVEEKEFSLDGQVMAPERKTMPISYVWHNKDRR